MPRPPMQPQVRAPIWAVQIVHGMAMECYHAIEAAGDRPPEALASCRVALERIVEAIQEAQSPRGDAFQKPVFFPRGHFVTGARVGAEVLLDINGTTGHFTPDDWLIFPGDSPERATYIQDELFRRNFAPANAKAHYLLDDEDNGPPQSLLCHEDHDPNPGPGDEPTPSP